MILAANSWRRPAFLRMGFGLTALVACGLLVASCSEAPKIGKAPEPQPPSAEEKSTPGPAPQASAPAKPAPPSDVEPSEPEPQNEAAGGDASGQGKHSYHEKYGAKPPGETNEPSESDQSASGGGAAPEEAPRDEPRAKVEGPRRLCNPKRRRLAPLRRLLPM